MRPPKRIPPPDEAVIEAVDFLSVESAFDTAVDPTSLVEFCRSSRATGPLTFHLASGGIRAITLKQQKTIDDAQADTIRQLIGVASAK
jgi:hypothetical protein